MSFTDTAWTDTEGWPDFDRMRVRLSGRTWHIAKLFDENGEETDDPDEAVEYMAHTQDEWVLVGIARVTLQ